MSRNKFKSADETVNLIKEEETGALIAWWRPNGPPARQIRHLACV
jgi:hypothetical protein